jgi:hypothetical protein
MVIHLVCPKCKRGHGLNPAETMSWACPDCSYEIHLKGEARPSALNMCLVCGNSELYRKKNFPHWLGLTILTIACAGSIPFYYLYHQWVTWAILIGSAVVDGLLYLWVGDLIVCYRCGTSYQRFETLPQHMPFDLGIGERYRQERIRREGLQSARENR